MISFLRSLTELMAITQSRDPLRKKDQCKELCSSSEDSGQRKRYIRSEKEKEIEITTLSKISKHGLEKSKDFASKLFDELDYNNQIQSTYDLILLERQSSYEKQDVA